MTWVMWVHGEPSQLHGGQYSQGSGDCIGLQLWSAWNTSGLVLLG